MGFSILSGKLNKIVSALFIAGIILWGGVFLSVYYRHSPLRLFAYFQDWGKNFQGSGINLIPILSPIAAMIMSLLLAYFLGEKILNLLKISLSPRREYWPVSFLLGLFLISLVTFLLGIVGLLYSGVFRISLIILFIVLLIYYTKKITRKGRVSPLKRKNPDTLICWILLVIMGLVCLSYTLTPPVQSDGLRYHLFAPQEYIKGHRIQYIPLSALSNSPFAIEMLFMYGMLVNGDLLAKLFHFSLWILCIFLIRTFIFHFTSKPQNEKATFPSRNFIFLFSGLLFGTIPAISSLACWSFIDLGIAAYFLGFVFSLCLFSEKRERGFLILSGIFGGAALGTKYTMLPMILLGCLIIGIMEIYQSGAVEKEKSHRIPSFIRVPFFIGIIALILALPWYIKNLINTGNPFYPLLYQWFDGKDWSAANAAFYAAKAAQKGFPKTLFHLILSPFHATFFWKKFESFNPGPFVLFMLPFLLWILVLLKEKTKRKTMITLSIFSIGYYLMWFFGYQSNRFLIPFFMLIAVISGFILLDLREKAPNICRALCAVLFLCIIYSSAFSIRWILTETQPDPLPVFLGLETREQYLSKALDYYPAIRAVNEDVPPEETILCIGEHRGYYFKPKLLISDWFDTPVILDLIRKTKTNEEIFARLMEQRCTHVFYNKGELAKYREPYFKPRFKPWEFARFEDFLLSPRLELRYKINEVYIFKIKNTQEES